MSTNQEELTELLSQLNITSTSVESESSLQEPTSVEVESSGQLLTSVESESSLQEPTSVESESSLQEPTSVEVESSGQLLTSVGSESLESSTQESTVNLSTLPPPPPPQLELIPGGATLVNPETNFELLEQEIFTRSTVTFDCEGVDLSRAGELTLVSVGLSLNQSQNVELTLSHVFLFDMIHPDPDLVTRSTALLKRLCESSTIVKIIHDCRFDSDALYHHLGIRLENVFDTSVWQMKLTHSSTRTNLNDTLAYHRCSTNPARYGVKIYRTQPAYWRSRPLTEAMIEHASKDVALLFDLKRALERASLLQPASLVQSLPLACIENTNDLRSRQFVDMVLVPSNMGLVIGRGGSGIREIESSTKTILSTLDAPAGIRIFAHSASQLEAAKKKIRARAVRRAPTHRYSDY